MFIMPKWLQRSIIELMSACEYLMTLDPEYSTVPNHILLLAPIINGGPKLTHHRSGQFRGEIEFVAVGKNPAY